MTYLFTSGDEIKPFVSGIDVSFDIDNIESSLKQAVNDVTDLVGTYIYALALAHYQSDNYNVSDEETTEEETTEEEATDYTYLDNLVNYLQQPLAAFALLNHFPWLEIRVSNSGVTTVKSQNETAAYKYQTDKAKESLLQIAYSGFNSLVDFLNSEATAWSYWTAETDFTADSIIYYGGTFYTVSEDFTSGEEFDATNLTEKRKSEVVFYQWTLSDEKEELDALIFDGYKDFNKYYGIDKNAAFYIKARFIIQREIKAFVPSRFPDGVTDALLDDVKYYLAYKVMAEAIHDLDVNLLPVSIRGPINSEMNKKGGDVAFIRDKLHSKILNQAESYMRTIDMTLASEAATTETTEPLKKFEITPTKQQKYYSSL
jgi:hypothetical protein